MEKKQTTKTSTETRFNMKAQELRIGNLVLTVRKTIVTVSQISDNSILAVNAKSDTCRWYYKFLPIPLTEEWLVKNTIDGSPLIRIEHSGDIGLWIEKKDKHFYLTDDHDDYISLNEIKYVHQLQNLYFALTGQELELKP